VFAVADALDAMTTDRPYRPGARFADARREIVGAAGTQFDPDVVRALDQMSDSLLERLRAQIG
jgi:HD-GYP domain-containing protein (c-di-GMP phosphodiesterase class II)